MVKKLNSIAIFCMLCSAAIPSLMGSCAQCSDCDNTDKDKDRSKQSVMLFRAATEDKKNEKRFIFEVEEEKGRTKTDEKAA